MKRSTTTLAHAVAAAVLLALVLASPAVALEAPKLRPSRTCTYVGTATKLTLTVPAPLVPPPLPASPGGYFGSKPAVGLNGRHVTAELVAYRREKGGWRVVSTTPISRDVTRTSVTAWVRPRRGRYRYVARVRSWKGMAESNAVEMAVVGTNVVALTFDDGPWPTSTASILGTLGRKDVRATFFMCGYTLAAYPRLGQAVVRDGQEVGNHTYSHANLASLSDDGIERELTRTQALIKTLLGVIPTSCRPPYGSTSTRVKGVIEDLGMKQVLWDVDPNDWKRPGASVIVSRVVSGVRPGYVVLMHDGGGDRSGTAAAVPVIIDRLRAKDYDFVTVSELDALKAGR